MHCVPDCKAPHGVRHEQHCDPPCSAEIRTKNKLQKVLVVKKVPTYKWVVEVVCDACAQKCGDDAIPLDEPAPAGDEGDAPSPPMAKRDTAMPSVVKQASALISSRRQK
jgi:hypothetical protein